MKYMIVIVKNEVLLLELDLKEITSEQKNALEAIAASAYIDNEELIVKDVYDIAYWFKEELEKELQCKSAFKGIDLEVSIE